MKQDLAKEYLAKYERGKLTLDVIVDLTLADKDALYWSGVFVNHNNIVEAIHHAFYDKNIPITFT